MKSQRDLKSEKNSMQKGFSVAEIEEAIAIYYTHYMCIYTLQKFHKIMLILIINTL